MDHQLDILQTSVLSLNDSSNSVPATDILPRIVTEHPSSCTSQYRGSYVDEATERDGWIASKVDLKSLQMQHVPTHGVHTLLSCTQHNKNGSIYNAQHQTLNHALIYQRRQCRKSSPSTFWRSNRRRRLSAGACTPFSETFWTVSQFRNAESPCE
jgi:hypothetical protein